MRTGLRRSRRETGEGEAVRGFVAAARRKKCKSSPRRIQLGTKAVSRHTRAARCLASCVRKNIRMSVLSSAGAQALGCAGILIKSFPARLGNEPCAGTQRFQIPLITDCCCSFLKK